MSSIYHVPVVSVRARAVYSNSSPTRRLPQRRAAGGHVRDRAADRSSPRTCGFDRLALRRMNFIPPDALPYVNPFGMTYDSGLYEKVFNDAVALADWSGFETRRAASQAKGLHRGIGTGCYIESASGAPHERAIVKVCPTRPSPCNRHALVRARPRNELRAIAQRMAGRGPRSGDADHRRFRLGHSGGRLAFGTLDAARGDDRRRQTNEIVAKGCRIAAHLLCGGAEANRLR